MEKVRLGKSELMVSRVGFGGIPITRVSDAEATRCIRAALDLGVNFIDTATGYGDSEEKIGRALQGVERENVIIATKAPPNTAEKVLAALDLSLQRMQTDYVDLFQFHNIDAAPSLRRSVDMLEALEAARDAGKLRHIGATAHGVDWVNSVIEVDVFETIMVSLNFIMNEPVDIVLPVARQHDVGVIAMKPMGGGHIEDVRLAFRFMLDCPGVVPLVGIEKPDEIREIARIVEADERLTDEDRDEMARIRLESGLRFCRRCGYCLPCPEGVAILPATLFRSVVKRMCPEYAVKGWAGAAAKTVEKCTQCGACVERCPYHLDVIGMLQENLACYEELVEQMEAGSFEK